LHDVFTPKGYFAHKIQQESYSCASEKQRIRSVVKIESLIFSKAVEQVRCPVVQGTDYKSAPAGDEISFLISIIPYHSINGL